MAASVTRQLQLTDGQQALSLFGKNDSFLPLYEAAFGVQVHVRGGAVTIRGEAKGVDRAEAVLTELAAAHTAGRPLERLDVESAIEIGKRDVAELKGLRDFYIAVPGKKRFVRPLTVNQKKYMEAIRATDLTFGIGPAGTGKTYLAVAMGVAALKAGQVARMVLVRPAVEAGEKLGYLPGDLREKVDPYLRPIYDALFTMLEYDKFQQYMERGTIEVAPLAFMRGRTLSDAFIILDEAQNTTPEQMKMFLTRLGVGSRTVVTGDVTQIDLPSGRDSGLIRAAKILSKVEGIRFITLGAEDVVRHELVQRIVLAYEASEGTGRPRTA